MTVGEVTARLTLDLTGFREGLAKANSLLEQYSGQMQKAGMVIAGFGAAVTAAMGLAVREAGEMQSALVALNKVLHLTPEELAGMAEGLDTLAIETGIADEILAATLADIAKAGMAGADAVEVLNAAAKAAVAGTADIKSIGDSLVSIIRAYGLGASEAAIVADTLYKASTKGRMSLEEVAGAIQGLAPVAAQLNIGYADLAAALATVTSVGYDAENAIMGLTRTMINLTNPGKELKEALHAAGYESGQALIKAKGLAGAIDFLTKAAGDDEQKMIQLAGGARAYKIVAALAGDQSAVFAQKLAELGDSAGSVASAVAETGQTFRKQWERFGQSTKEILEAIGTGLLPLLTRLVTLMRQAGAAARVFASQHQTLVAVFAVVTAALGLLTTAAGAAMLALGTLGVSVLAAPVGLAALGGILAAVTAAVTGFAATLATVALSPIGLAILGLVAALSGLAHAWSVAEAGEAAEAKQAEETRRKLIAEDDALIGVAQRARDLAEKKKLTAAETRDLAKAMDQLKEKFPELLRHYDEEYVKVEALIEVLRQLHEERNKALGDAFSAMDAQHREALGFSRQVGDVNHQIALLEEQQKSMLGKWEALSNAGKVLAKGGGLTPAAEQLRSNLQNIALQLQTLRNRLADLKPVADKTWAAVYGAPGAAGVGGPATTIDYAGELKNIKAREETLRVTLQVAMNLERTQKEINADERAYYDMARTYLPFVRQGWAQASGDQKTAYAGMLVTLSEIMKRHGALADQDKASAVQQGEATRELLMLDVKRADTHEKVVKAAQAYVNWLVEAKRKYEELAAAPGAKPEIVRFAADLAEQFRAVGTAARWTGISSAEALARITRQQEDGLPVYKDEAEAIQGEIQGQQALAQIYNWSARQQAVALEKLRDLHKGYYAERPAELEKLNAQLTGLWSKAAEQEIDLEIEKAGWLAQQGKQSLQVYLDLLDKKAAAHKEEANLELDATRARIENEQALEEQAWQYRIEIGEKELADYLGHLQDQAATMVPWELPWLAKMQQIAQVRRQLHQEELSQIDEEIAAAAQGSAALNAAYQRRLDTIEQLLQGERNIANILDLQREKRATIDAWIQSDLWKLDQQVLSLHEQRDALIELAQHWGQIDVRVLPAIQERLRAINEQILAQRFTWQNLAIGAGSGMEQAFSGFFQGLMDRTKGFADLWMDVVAAIEQSLATLLTNLLIHPFFERLERARQQMAVRETAKTTAVAAGEAAVASTDQLPGALNAWAQAADALVPGLGGWVASAAQLLVGLFIQPAVATTEVSAAGLMMGVAATQIGAGGLMGVAAAAMAAAAVVMMVAATTYAAASAAGGLLGFLGLQGGGIVTRPTLSVLGERGPEAVIPLSEAGQFGATFEAGAIVINLDPAGMDALSVDRLADRLMNSISRKMGRLSPARGVA